jgi:endonuclease G
MAILEKGAQAETGRLAKLSVFNGPIFKDSDPVLQGIPIPMDYWKIVLWLNEQKQLKATGFLLSQENLVEDIDFDEAIDLDDRVEFAPYMVPVATLAKLTGINFDQIEKFDTYRSGTGEERIDLKDLDQIDEMVTSWNNADLA